MSTNVTEENCLPLHKFRIDPDQHYIDLLVPNTGTWY
jgi:hypothetical protein